MTSDTQQQIDVTAELRELVDDVCEAGFAQEMEAGCDLDGPVLAACEKLGIEFTDAAQKVWGDDHREILEEAGFELDEPTTQPV